MRRFVLLTTGSLAAIVILAYAHAPGTLRFAVFGDRTGEALPGVYEECWKEAAAQDPEFVLTAGDTIEGGDDGAAAGEWENVARVFRAYGRIPLYLVPGNHDVWSRSSEELYRKYSGRPLHYGFDRGPVHFTVLDNSRTEDLPESELAFLREDLRAHAAQPVKIVLSHRPSWLLRLAVGDTQFPLHRIAKEYGVTCVLAGHLHQLVHGELEGVAYISVPSSGGHLRLSRRYEDGWFFGYTLVEVRQHTVTFGIRELEAPHGQGRTSVLDDWGLAGLRAGKAPAPTRPLR